MKELIVRPPVAALHFRLHDAIAPVPDAVATWASGPLTITLTPAGHVLHWQDGGHQVVEEIGVGQQAGLLALPFDRERRGRVKLACGGTYTVSLHAEVVTPDLFVHLHDELVADGQRRGLFHRFNADDRIRITPVSLVVVEPIRGGLSFAAFHTFPDEFTIVKTQSLLEAPLR